MTSLAILSCRFMLRDIRRSFFGAISRRQRCAEDNNDQQSIFLWTNGLEIPKVLKRRHRVVVLFTKFLVRYDDALGRVLRNINRCLEAWWSFQR